MLGVSKDASEQDIKRAFRKLAKEHHPDVNKDPGAEDKFKSLQEAYSVLSDPKAKAQYDQFGHSAFEPGGSGTGHGGFTGQGFDFSGMDFDLNDIFESMMGGGYSSFGGRNRARKGRDQILRMNLTFEEAVFGTKETIILDVDEECSDCNGKGGTGEKTCSECDGSGTITGMQNTIFGQMMSRTTCNKCSGQGATYDKTCQKCRGKGTNRVDKEIEVTIPAGVDTGNQIRLRGKGEAGTNGGPNGDVYIEFMVKSHPFYKRENFDIHLTVPLTITQAALGDKITVPTIHGPVKLTIPAGTTGNTTQRIKGKGINNPNSYRSGDMYVKLEIVTPDKLTKEQKKLFKELAKTDLSNSKFKKYQKFVNDNS